MLIEMCVLRICQHLILWPLDGALTQHVACKQTLTDKQSDRQVSRKTQLHADRPFRQNWSLWCFLHTFPGLHYVVFVSISAVMLSVRWMGQSDPLSWLSTHTHIHTHIHPAILKTLVLVRYVGGRAFGIKQFKQSTIKASVVVLNGYI